MQQSTDSYIAKPASGKGPGLLVLHAWWGLNPFMRSLCDRLADEGFVVLAPDLYQGRVAATIAEAEALRNSLKQEETAREIAKSAVALRSLCGAPPQVGVSALGFSMGAAWALWLSSLPAPRINAVSAFYGLRPGDFSSSTAAFQFHLAESDPYTTTAEEEGMKSALNAAHREAVFYTYPGTGHWFFESDRSDAYNAEAASLAWERTLAFLRRHGG